MHRVKKPHRSQLPVATLEPLQNSALAFPQQRDGRWIYNGHRPRTVPLGEGHRTEHVCKHAAVIEEPDLHWHHM